MENRLCERDAKTKWAISIAARVSPLYGIFVSPGMSPEEREKNLTVLRRFCAMLRGMDDYRFKLETRDEFMVMKLFETCANEAEGSMWFRKGDYSGDQ